MPNPRLRRLTEAATLVLVVAMVVLVILTLFIMSPLAWECVV